MQRSAIRSTAPILACLLVACGGSTFASVDYPDAADAGSKARDAEHDGRATNDGGDAALDAPAVPPPADGPFACGTSTCSATQFCLVPCVDITFPAPACVTTGTTCPSPSTPGDAGCDGGTLCEYPETPQPTCVDSPPCSPRPNLCDVEGRTYTELGCA